MNWQSISLAPRDGSEILVKDSSDRVGVVRWVSKSENEISTCGNSEFWVGRSFGYEPWAGNSERLIEIQNIVFWQHIPK